MAQNVQGTIISGKVNKIRWRPDPFGSSHSFITGTWDSRPNNINFWDFRETEDSDVYPFTLVEEAVNGDITEAKFLNADLFLVSTSLGTLKLFKIIGDISGSYTLTEQIQWHKLHGFNNGDEASCTSFDTYESDVVTVGEDGRINFLTASKKEPLHTIDDADSCTLNCVTFLKHNEILTGNSRGHMKIWDSRTNNKTPSNKFMLSSDQIMPTCVVHHPSQRHILIAGDEEGSLTVWDLRQNTFPVNLLSAHTDSVSEIQFHPDYPDQLFSCSSAGEIWHWVAPPKSGPSTSHELDNNPLFLTESIKNNLEVYALMPKLHKPINSLDIHKDKVLCGCDNEAMYLINNVNLFA